MMRRAPVKGTQMHVGAGGMCEALKKILDELDLEIADALCRDLCMHHAKGPPAEIDGGGGECFVHGHEEISGAQDAAFRTESFLHGFSERNSDVFDGVMLVHVEIAAGLRMQIKCAMPGDEFQHVVKEANACGNAGFSAAIEIQLQADVGFVCLAMDCGGARHIDLFAAQAVRRALST